MKPLLLLVLAVAAGCGKGKPPNVQFVTPPPPPAVQVAVIQPQASHEAQIYAELGRVCHEKHLTYLVSENLGQTFAWAWDQNSSFNGITGDRIDYWEVSYVFWNRGPTKAAEELTKLIKGPPNHISRKDFTTGEVTP